MNTTERRKLEGVVTSKLAETRKAYQSRRENELNGIVEMLESNPPDAIKKMVEQRKSLESDYEQKCKALDEQKDALSDKHRKVVEELEEKAKKLGYKIRVCYSGDVEISLASETTYTGRYNDQLVRTYSEPKLTKHVAETQQQLQKFDDLASEYVVQIWSESPDMGEVHKRFRDELTKLAA